ncbi:MAG: hypothetical protein P1U32_02000 [Legionellaceae bacterium]|nr:hypothetical protein [Legionellaceae bacterium]
MSHTISEIKETTKKNEGHAEQGYSYLLSALGAAGVALQNYQAVELFAKGVIPLSQWSYTLTQAIALGAGGLCSGMVNFWMNMDLLEDFFKRMKSDKSCRYKQLKPWEKVQYFGGIFIFSVTGVLFGLTAFTFAMTGPLAMLSVAAGIFVAAIMTIQEIETWLSSYDETEKKEKETLTLLQQAGKWCGHLIAMGNVVALSLLFTLSLAEGLMLLQVAALPALITGFLVAFSFGAFTEYYFYNFYLSEFCKNFGDKWQEMMAAPNAMIGILCVFTNAFVNAALTYSAHGLFTTLLVAAHVVLPPAAVMTTLFAVSAFFAGSASLILGMDFWIKKGASHTQTSKETCKPSVSGSRYGLFSANTSVKCEAASDASANAQEIDEIDWKLPNYA